MGVVVGGRVVESVMLGDRPVTKLMLGNDKVWPTGGGTYVADWSDGWGPEWVAHNYVPIGTNVGSLGIGSNGQPEIEAPDRTGGLYYVELTGYDCIDFDLTVGLGLTSGRRAPTYIGWRSTTPLGGAYANPGYRLYVQRSKTGGRVEAAAGGSATEVEPNGWAALGGTDSFVRVQMIGTAIRGKVWEQADPEPATWGLEISDSTLTGPGSVMIGVGRDGAGGNNRVAQLTNFELTILG